MKDYEKKISTLLRSASRFRQFPVTRQDLGRFIYLLCQYQPADLWELIRRSDLYIRVIISLLYAMEKEGLISVLSDGGLKLTRQGFAIGHYLNINKSRVLVEPKEKFGLRLTPKFKHILEVIKELHSSITPQNIYDQAPLVPEAAVQKAAYAINQGDISGKSIVCIGDDDLISVILALSGLPGRILAIDIDEYLLETIEEFSEKNNLGIETLRHDLRKPVPEKYRDNFDLFITEPPDTVKGISLFVSRGVELLKKESGLAGYCGISVTACPPLGLLEIQKNFDAMGLIVSERLPKFSDYPPHRTELKHIEVPDCYDQFYPPQKIWYSADLLRLKTTRYLQPLFDGELRGNIANYREDAKRFQ